MSYSVQVTIPYFTGIAKDVITNTFNYSWDAGGAPGASDFLNLRNAIFGFYEGIWLTGGPYGMAPWVNATAARIKIYNLDDPEPRVPVYDNTNALVVKKDTAGVLPPEVSLVLSFHGNYISGVPLARQRGRIFLGGIGDSCVLTSSASAYPVPNATWRTLIGTTARSNLKLGAAAFSWQWNVLSRTAGLGFEVYSGWVDNAFDTQRRRGQAATSRSLWGP